MVYLKYDLNDEKVQYLIRTDKTLERLIRYIGTSELAMEKMVLNVLSNIL